MRPPTGHDEHGGNNRPEHSELVTTVGKDPHITNGEVAAQQHGKEEIKGAERITADH